MLCLVDTSLLPVVGKVEFRAAFRRTLSAFTGTAVNAHHRFWAGGMASAHLVAEHSAVQDLLIRI
jgi:hypothetical protein